MSVGLVVLLVLAAFLIGWTVGHRTGQSRALPRHRPGTTIEPPRDLAVELGDEQRHRIAATLGEGRTIEAIRLYRQATGAGLAEAKRIVDQWAARGSATPPPGIDGGSPWPELPPENRA